MTPLRVLSLALVLLMAKQTSCVKWIPSFAGPWLFILERVYDCEAGESGFNGDIHFRLRFSHFNPVKRNELQAIYGNITFRSEFNDSYWAGYNVASRSNNQWQQNAMIMKFPVAPCSTLRTNWPDAFQKLFGLDPSSQGPCAIPAATYSLQGVRVNWTAKNFPVLPYGRYRFLALTGVNGRNGTAMCAYNLVQIIPKT